LPLSLVPESLVAMQSPFVRPHFKRSGLIDSNRVSTQGQREKVKAHSRLS